MREGELNQDQFQSDTPFLLRILFHGVSIFHKVGLSCNNIALLFCCHFLSRYFKFINSNDSPIKIITAANVR